MSDAWGNQFFEDLEKIKSNRKKELKSFIDEITPTHTKTSCTDEDSIGNEYFNEYKVPRCTRCALLYRLKNGSWPHGVKVKSLTIEFE